MEGPSVGMPMGMVSHMGMPRGPVSRTVPTGTCHLIWRDFRSTAVMVPKGGFWQGMPSGDRKRWRMAPNGVPSWGTAPISMPLAPGFISARAIM